MPPVSHYVHLDGPSTARQRIDEEIAQLNARIISLKTTRNTFTVVARLPIEVLEQIFVITARSAGDQGVGKGALFISWVCRSWRELALQTSALWSYVDFLDLNWVETALARTRNQPLHL
ncbi:hypothetical protein BDN72DRAFT_782324, partial [Pluteus cervinus]